MKQHPCCGRFGNQLWIVANLCELGKPNCSRTPLAGQHKKQWKNMEKQSNAASKILWWDVMLKGLTTQLPFDLNLIQLLHHDSFGSQNLSANQQLSACTVTWPSTVVTLATA